MYMGKWLTGILYLLTGGLFVIGWVYDFCTLNTQISERNAAAGGKPTPSSSSDRLIEG
jgi:hypothetical protein